MDLYYSPRRTGKTVRMIERAARDNLLIVCSNQREATRIFNIAKELGKNIYFPITFEEFRTGRYRAEAYRGLAIDQADDLIQHVGVGTVKVISMTSDSVEPLEKPDPKVEMAKLLLDLLKDNEFAAVMGTDRSCVEFQLSVPKNASLLKKLVQLAMLSSDESKIDYLKRHGPDSAQKPIDALPPQTPEERWVENDDPWSNDPCGAVHPDYDRMLCVRPKGHSDYHNRGAFRWLDRVVP